MALAWIDGCRTAEIGQKFEAICIAFSDGERLDLSMKNDLHSAEFWKSFVIDRCEYPAIGRLKAQLEGAEFSDFCSCGCNSFRVKVGKDVPPLVTRRENSRRGLIYEADFKMADGRTIEVLLFANSNGDLDYIEVDCCANSFSIPDTIEVGEPYFTRASELLLADE